MEMKFGVRWNGGRNQDVKDIKTGSTSSWPRNYFVIIV
jgi:hypothetical protein